MPTYRFDRMGTTTFYTYVKADTPEEAIKQIVADTENTEHAWVEDPERGKALCQFHETFEDMETGRTYEADFSAPRLKTDEELDDPDVSDEPREFTVFANRQYQCTVEAVSTDMAIEAAASVPDDEWEPVEESMIEWDITDADEA